jgi:hypothetical protein
MVLCLRPSKISDTIIIVNQIDPASIHITYTFVVDDLVCNKKANYNSFLLPLKTNPASTIGQSSLYDYDLDQVNQTISYIYEQKNNFDPTEVKKEWIISTLDSDENYLHCAHKLESINNFVGFIDDIHGLDYRPKYFPDMGYVAKRTGIRFGYQQQFLYYPIRESDSAQRVYVAYTVYNNEGIIWLPTCLNNSNSLKFMRKVKRDCTIIWGGMNKNHKGCKVINPEPSNTHYSPSPKYLYGIADFEMAHPDSHFMNGYIGIDMTNTDSDNLIINKDSSAIHFSSIF